MRLTVYLLLLASLVTAVLAPRVAVRLAPAAAARTLVLLAVAAAASTVWGLVVLALAGLSRTGEVQRVARTNPQLLLDADPVTPWVGAAAALLLLVGAARAGRRLHGRARATRAQQDLRALPAAGDLLIADQQAPEAFALPGRPARVLVSTGLLRLLSADERRVVLAHERAHLRHRHHLLTTLALVAAALNPALGPAATHLDYHLERWADEDAAAVVASRSVAARSLARAALARLDPRELNPAGPASSVLLGYLGAQVPARVGALVGALVAPAPITRWTTLGPALAIPVLTLVAMADVAAAVHELLDLLL